MALRSPTTRHSYWGRFEQASLLPNTTEGPVRDILEPGDTAWVSAVGLYVCFDATVGAALWQLLSSAGVSSRLYNVEPLGQADGQNVVFALPVFVNGSQAVFVNGVRMSPGVGNDYVTAESGGGGTGFDTLVMAVPPDPGSSLLVDYDPV